METEAKVPGAISGASMFIYSCSQTIKTIDLKKIIIAENANI
jgi:hypothetical protein